MSSKKQTIAVDIDDVLSASAKSFVEFSNMKWDTSLEVDDYDERWAVMWGVNHEEHNRRKNIIYESKVFQTMEKMNDAEITLKNLSREYRLIITTSRAIQAKTDTEEWVDSHFKGIFEEIHLAGFYDVVTEESHKKTKADLLKSLDVDYLIDDHPKHCLAAAKAGIKAVMFGYYSWNKNIKLPENVIRAHNWREVKQYFGSNK